MLGKRWTNKEILESVKVKEDHFMTIEQYEEFKKKFHVIDKTNCNNDFKIINKINDEDEEKKYNGILNEYH